MALVVIAPSLPAQATTLTPIPTLGRVGTALGDDVIRLSGINESNIVVGNSRLSNNRQRGFRWDAVGGIANLGVLGSGDTSQAGGINESGVISGGTRTIGNSGWRVTRRGPSATSWQNLGAFGAPVNANGFGINDRGDIVLNADLSETNRQGKIRLADGSTRNLQQANTWSQPWEVNIAGNVVGISGRNNNQRASFWDFSVPGGNLPVTRIDPLAGFERSHARDLNDGDRVVGYSFNTGGERRAFTWQAGDPAGAATPLMHGEDTTRSHAEAINNGGDIVGWIEDSAGLRSAALWRDGGLFDLNQLLPPALAADWHLFEAQVINDAGAIGGVGLNPDGQISGFLLTDLSFAVPAPASALLLGFALPVLLRRR